VSSLRRYIRPNRDDVIRWYIKVTMVVALFASGDIWRTIVNTVDVENGVVRWLIRFVTIAIPLTIFVVMSERSRPVGETLDERS